jgi:hypothetical protein
MPFLMNRFTGGDKLAVGLFTLVSSLAAAAAMLVLGAASDRVVPRMGRAPIVLGLLAPLDAGVPLPLRMIPHRWFYARNRCG